MDALTWTGPEKGGATYTVVLATGLEDGGKRATLALSMACTALSMELDTQVFLVGDGGYWAYEGHAPQVSTTGFPPLAELLDDFVALGGQITLCSTCHRAACGLPGNGGLSHRLRTDVQVQGMATLLARSVDGRVVTF